MNTSISCRSICRRTIVAASGRAIGLSLIVLLAAGNRFSQPCAAQNSRTTTRVQIEEPELMMFRDPELKMPDAVRHLPVSYLELWIEALGGPEQDLKREMAMNIRRAHGEGFRDCSDATDALIAVLNDDTAPREVMVEVARALIALDARNHSEKLKEVLKNDAGTQFQRIVERALATWHDGGMLTEWQQRLTAEKIPRYRRLLALQCLALLPESMTDSQKLHTELQHLMMASRDTAIQLEAARTLGRVRKSGLEDVAQGYLTASGNDASRQQLAGVYLLLHHSSDTSRRLLQQVITAGLSAPRLAPVIRTAWRLLLDQNVSELASLSPQAIQSSDPELRRAAIETLVRFPSAEGVELLGVALDDPHPEIRRAARQGLLKLGSETDWSKAVTQAGVAAIERSSWREQEQAVMLLALLDHTESADRMLELMKSLRPEVAVAAAWGLRRLNVAGTMPSLLKYAEALDQQINDRQLLQPHDPIVLAHVFEALGKAKHEPAIPLLKRWIPKKFPRVSLNASRAAAIWALGWLYEGSQDLALARLLTARVVDVLSLEPELAAVRHTAAVAVGRIGSSEVASQLKPFADARQTPADLAAAWAVTRLTGEVIAPPAAPIDTGNLWKLIPVGSRRKATSVEATVR